MNERIRELADEVANLMPAGVYTIEYESGKSGVEFTEDALEKFAELIVRECARIGELKEQGYCEYDPDISVGWYMRQHFGVEE